MSTKGFWLLIYCLYYRQTIPWSNEDLSHQTMGRQFDAGITGVVELRDKTSFLYIEHYKVKIKYHAFLYVVEISHMKKKYISTL